MKIKTITKVLTAISVLALGACNSENSNSGLDSDTSLTQDQAKPNILVILTDDQRYDTLSYYTPKELETPNIDELANTGVSFNNAYILGAPHGAVCSPSRAMMMTGKPYFNIEKNVYQIWSFKGEEKGKSALLTFPEYLKQHGYYTFATGKQHNGHPWVEQGFDKLTAGLMGGMSNHYGAPVKNYSKETGWTDIYRRHDKYSSELFADSAIEFLDGYKQDNPFLLYLAFSAPHDPRTAPDNYHDFYNKRDVKLPDNFQPLHPFPITDMKIRDEKLAAFPRTEKEVSQHIRDYYAMITATDYQIGRVIQRLKDLGMYDNTLIVFSSDNGLAVGQHGLLGKQSVYEHSVKVPFIVTGPGVPNGVEENGLVYLHDLFPTLVDVVGGERPESIESESLLPIIQGKQEEVRDAIYFSYKSTKHKKTGKLQGGHRAVRQGDYKLILSYENGTTTELLFNLANDPLEQNNLVSLPQYQQKRDDLFDVLQQKMRKHNDDAREEYTAFGQGSTDKTASLSPQ